MSLRSFHSTPALKVTAALHLGGALGLALAGGAAGPWVAGALAVNYGAMFGASLAPRSQLLGPNVVRLPETAARRGEVALTFDDGPDPDVTPLVLDLLEKYQARASFFAIGERAALFPHLVREIAARGHSVESHSHAHSTGFGFFGPRRFARDLGAAQRGIALAAGTPPVFFRAPFGTRSPILAPALEQLGLVYVSWTRRGFDTVEVDEARVLARLVKNLAAGDILLLHDGIHHVKRRGQATSLRVLPRLLDVLAARGLRSVTLRDALVP